MSLVMTAAVVLYAGLSTWAPRAAAHKGAYPQIYECPGDSTANLYASTSFKTRHTRFINELADSIRAFQKQMPDSLRMRCPVIALYIEPSGKVDSAVVSCGGIVADSMRNAMQTTLLSWHFLHSSERRILVLQDIDEHKRYTGNFYKSHRKMVWVGGAIILGALLFFL